MDKVYLYIKRLISFFICFAIFLFAQIHLHARSLFILFPLLLIIFATLHSRITGELPGWLHGFPHDDQETGNNRLQWLRRKFNTVTSAPLTFVLWVTWGGYLVILLLIDLLDFLKNIIFRIIHGLFKLLYLYIPFIILICRLTKLFLIQWPWRLYQIAFSNIRYAYNINCYKISLTGTIQTATLLFIFLYISLLTGTISWLLLVGFCIALLPVIWIFGEIASLKAQNLQYEPYKKVRLQFQNGIETVRSILFYLILFIILLLLELGIYLLGWIPGSGILFAGLGFNLSFIINLLLMFFIVMIILNILIIPSCRLYIPFNEFNLQDNFKLIKRSISKIFQYFLVSIPVMFFSVIIIFLPLVFLFFVTFLSYSIKNNVTEVKINRLKMEQSTSDNITEAYTTGKKIEYLKYLQKMPVGLLFDIENRDKLAASITDLEAKTKSAETEILLNKVSYEHIRNSIDIQIDSIEKLNSNDLRIIKLKSWKDKLDINYNIDHATCELKIKKLNIDIEFLAIKYKQIPILFLLIGFWLIFCGSLIAALVIAYIGNVLHQVYIYRSDNQIPEWHNIVDGIKEKDPRQPLLGGTLFVMSAVILLFLLLQNERIADLISLLSRKFQELQLSFFNI